MSTPTDLPLLRLDGVTVRVPGRTLVDGVSLDVWPGTITVLIGPNGAGKSSLLRVVSGERMPDAGTISVRDGDTLTPMHALAPDRLARRRAHLPQESALAFGFTAAEVVALGRTPHRTGADADTAAVARALDDAGALDLVARRYPTLSGGEKQRVHLARVLAQLDSDEAALLLLDEPTNNLDLAHQHRVLDVARTLAGRGLAVVVVLHDLNLAAQVADRIAMLRDGRLVASGAPTDVLTPDAIASTFGVTAMVVPHPCLACPLVLPLAPGTPVPAGARIVAPDLDAAPLLPLPVLPAVPAR